MMFVCCGQGQKGNYKNFICFKTVLIRLSLEYSLEMVNFLDTTIYKDNLGNLHTST